MIINDLVPRRSTRVVWCDAGEGVAARAAGCMSALGYTDVSLLDGGLTAWEQAGYRVYNGVHVPSKAFAEVVEHEAHTPWITAEQLQGMIDRGEDIVIFDSRSYEEYHSNSIPGAISVPGAELVYRFPDLTPSPDTTVIVNCGVKGHIPGAWFAIRARLRDALHKLPPTDTIVLTSPDGVLAQLAAADLDGVASVPVKVLSGGTQAWCAAGFPLEQGATHLADAVTRWNLSPSPSRVTYSSIGVHAMRTLAASAALRAHAPVPTGAGVIYTPRLLADLARVRLQPGNVVRADTGAETLAAEPLQPVGERLKIGLELRVERRPVPGVLFRPEEIHPRSAPGAIFRGATHLTVGIADEVVGFDPEHLLIAHHSSEGGPTV